MATKGRRPAPMPPDTEPDHHDWNPQQQYLEPGEFTEVKPPECTVCAGTNELLTHLCSTGTNGTRWLRV